MDDGAGVKSDAAADGADDAESVGLIILEASCSFVCCLAAALSGVVRTAADALWGAAAFSSLAVALVAALS